MNSRCKNDYFLVLLKPVRTLVWILLGIRIEAALVVCCVVRYGFPLVQYAISGGNGHHLHFPAFDRVVYCLSVEVQVLFGPCSFKLLLNLIYLGLGLFVTEWIRECEESRFVWLVAEHVLESQNKLFIVVHKIVCFRENPSPFLLSIR